MDTFLKNKQLIIGVVVVVVLLLVGGAFVLTSQKKVSVTSDTTENQVVLNMKPEDIGLSLSLTPDNKKVTFSASKLENVTHLEWEFSYDANIPDSDDGSAADGGKVTQSFGGETDVKSSSYDSVPRELGTCSTGGKCRYDTGIEKVTILLKITKADGKIYQITDSISL